jgi:hypothetical protein
VLRDLGYIGSGQISSMDQNFPLSPRQEAKYLRYAGEQTFFHGDNNLLGIDTHTQNIRLNA